MIPALPGRGAAARNAPPPEAAIYSAACYRIASHVPDATPARGSSAQPGARGWPGGHGVTAHSLAVLAAGGDYLLDAAGVGVALLAIRLSARRAGNGPRQGSLNASSVAALINSGWLLALEVLVSAAAIDRLITGTPHVDGLPVLIVSGIAALAMAGGALVLRRDGDDQEDETDERDLSVAAVLLDTIADAAAAAGVAATGAIILATGGWYWLDPR